MRKGDIVVIDTGSWSRTVENGGLTHGPGGDKYINCIGYIRKQYKVIETGCSFPATGSSRSCNNTVIQAVDSGKVVFIEERFLSLVPPKHKIVVDVTVTRLGGIYGKVVEISDKLYKEIKNESQA